MHLYLRFAFVCQFLVVDYLPCIYSCVFVCFLLFVSGIVFLCLYFWLFILSLSISSCVCLFLVVLFWLSIFGCVFPVVCFCYLCLIVFFDLRTEVLS